MISCVVLVENEGPKRLKYMYFFNSHFYVCDSLVYASHALWEHFRKLKLAFSKNTHISHVFGPSLSSTETHEIVRATSRCKRTNCRIAPPCDNSVKSSKSHIFPVNFYYFYKIVAPTCYAPNIVVFNYTHISNVLGQFQVLRSLQELHGMGTVMGFLVPPVSTGKGPRGRV